MEKLNTLGLKLKSLKEELMKPDYPDVVKEALRSHADKLAETTINVDLHISLTDEKIGLSEFNEILLETKDCLKSYEEMFVEYERIREKVQLQLDEEEKPTNITSSSLVDEEKLAFTKTFKIDKQWVSDYFGQPADEVGKLMVRNGFIEKFAVLRLSKILEDFLKSEYFYEDKIVECKATRVFYDVEKEYYGIHLMFYMTIENAEDEEKVEKAVEYIRRITEKSEIYVGDRLIV